MVCVTDDQRRHVAKMLRKSEGPSLMVLMSTLGVGGDRVLDRLADLIEPDQDHYAGPDKKVDRDSLLALADGLEADADSIIKAAKNARFGGGPTMDEAKHDAYEWRSIARQIREACGEVE